MTAIPHERGAKPKRGPGRPPVGSETKIALTPEQIAWLDRQGRPRAETIRALIDKARQA